MSQKIKVLIAEDEHSIANSLKLMLESTGFEVVIANNGVEAVDNLKKTKFDILLLDIMMPILDGFGVLEEMNNSNIKVPVIISTNLSQKEDVEKAKKYGVKDYFIKSDISLVDVVEHVKKVLKI